MSIVLIFNNKDPKPWAESLTKQLPETAIHVYPNVGDPDLIHFAICWKPANYVLNEFPNLKVIQSAGAGVDHILRTQTIRPNQVLTRIVDDNLTHDMWEFLLAAVLSNIKKLPFYARQQNDKNWSPTPYQTFKTRPFLSWGLGKSARLRQHSLRLWVLSSKVGHNRKNTSKMCNLSRVKMDLMPR